MKLRPSLLMVIASMLLVVGAASADNEKSAGSALQLAQAAKAPAPAASQAPKKEEDTSKSTGAVKPVGVAVGPIEFACDSRQCSCQGAADCFDLGTRNLCGARSWVCAGSGCVCSKKSEP